MRYTFNLVCHLIRIYRNVSLTFKDGKIIDAKCDGNNESLNEIFDSVCKEHKIPQKYRAKLYRAINGLIEEDSFEEDKVSEAILVNYDMMKGKN